MQTEEREDRRFGRFGLWADLQEAEEHAANAAAMHTAEVERLQIERDAAFEAGRLLAAEHREREEQLRANIAEMEARLRSQLEAERSALAENVENLERADASRGRRGRFRRKRSALGKGDEAELRRQS